MKNYLVVVECAIEYKDKLLIIKRPPGGHAGGLLSFPGGKVEAQDELNPVDVLRNALKREIFEEVGLVIKDPLRYVTSTYFVDSQGVHVIDSIFHCVLEKTMANVVASEREVPAYYWMNQEEINQAENAPDWLKHYVRLINGGGRV